MTTIAFDTLKYAQRLEEAGFPRDQAIAMAEVQKDSLSEIMDVQIATKADIKDVRGDIQAIRLKLIEYGGQFTLLKWMIGAVFAGVLSLVLKAFF